jgi:hypothetical protein
MAPSRLPLSEVDANIHRNTQSTRPGPKSKDLAHRTYNPTKFKQTQRVVRSYSREKKLDILLWLTHHEVYDPRPLYDQCYALRNSASWDSDTLIRSPTEQEAADFFKIPRRTISQWWQDRAKIIDLQKYGRSNRSYVQSEHYPELELMLFKAFQKARSEGQHVCNRGWFRRHSQKLAQLLASSTVESNNSSHPYHQFKFTYGWFNGFMTRWSIARRRVTKQAQKRPEAYQKYINNFLKFIRRISIRNTICPDSLQPISTNRFPSCRIMNMDETPLPWEFLDGYTYDLKGSRTVSAKTDRSG